MDTADKLLAASTLGVLALSFPLVSNADPHGSRRGAHGYRDAGPYVGAAIGRSHIETDLSGASEDLGSNDTGYKVFLGYGFNDFVRLEVGFIDLGDLREDLSFGGLGSQRVDVRADGPTVALELGLPVGEYLSINARGGVVFWDAEARINGFGVRDDGEDPFYGVSLRYRLGPHASVLGSAERFELDDVEVDVISLGVSFRF